MIQQPEEYKTHLDVSSKGICNNLVSAGAHIPKISGGVSNFLGPTFMAQFPNNNNNNKIFI